MIRFYNRIYITKVTITEYVNFIKKHERDFYSLNEVDFIEWADIIRRLFLEDANKSNLHFFSCCKTGITTCLDETIGEIGRAKCHPNDDFHKGIGYSIAYARLAGFPIPTMITTVALKDCIGRKIIYNGVESLVLPPISPDNEKIRIIPFNTITFQDKNTVIKKGCVYDKIF